MTGMSMMIRCAFNASAIAIPGVREKLDGALESYEITHMILNAEQVRRLLEKDFDAGRFPALKAILVADGGLSPSLAHRAIERHFPIYQSYGLTETAGQVTSVGLDSPPWKRKTHGRVLKYRDLKLGEDGEVLVKGATLCDGYVEAGNVRPVVGEDGWFATGDVGRLDEDRYLTVLGRKENSFVSRGKQVQPEAVEDALCAEHGVERAVVVPVSDKKSGLRPVAFVKIAGGKTELARLPGRLRKTLQAVEIPTDFFLLPRQGPCAGREGREYLRGVAEKRLTRKTD
jgi:O-succinylbenzoic acid--CoA ligase